MSCLRLVRPSIIISPSAQTSLRHRHPFSTNAFVGTVKRKATDRRTGHVHRLQTLAIETSCDDTSVAILAVTADKDARQFKTDVLFHETVTSKSEEFKGIHPIVALDSHYRELGPLIDKAVRHLRPEHEVSSTDLGQDPSLYPSAVSPAVRHNDESSNHENRSLLRPDFISVTRGPGMRSNLSAGLETAKGLAIAWNIPLVGVHHMQAHALTPRLCSTLRSATSPTKTRHQPRLPGQVDREARSWQPEEIAPQFPFLTLLASGGHTMLIDSTSLIEHKILAKTNDVALGDCLDKAARAILPKSEVKPPYGRALESFAFPDGRYDYTPPVSRAEELESKVTKWGWSLTPPLAQSKFGDKSNRRMLYSFAGLCSSVERLMSCRSASDAASAVTSSPSPSPSEVPLEERRDMARELQRVAFEHVASRILLHLTSLPPAQAAQIKTLILSGGVAANHFLRHVLSATLEARGFGHIRLSCPPSALCTDNALMIAWAGLEMFLAGYESELSVRSIRQWSMDPSAEDGGILGVGGWKR